MQPVIARWTPELAAGEWRWTGERYAVPERLLFSSQWGLGQGASDDLRQTSLPIQGAACARRQAHGYKAVPRLYVLRTGNCASGRRVAWASGQMSVKEMKEG